MRLAHFRRRHSFGFGIAHLDLESSLTGMNNRRRKRCELSSTILIA